MPIRCGTNSRLTTREDLDVRVVRSMTGVLEIPGARRPYRPGPACEGFVTNVEGVLDRIAQAIRIAVTDGDETEKERARVLLEKIECIKTGGLPVTLIIQDPMGNSVLVSDKAQKTAYVADDPDMCGD